MKRVFLFVATNIAVLAVISVVMRLLGFDHYMTKNGLDYRALAVFSLLWGSVGSFISLAASKWMAKKSMGVQIIDSPRTADEQWLVETVKRQAEAAGIGMPEVGVFQSSSPNAFATGMKKNDALVAVSTGLLQTMNKDEVEAVLGHEVAHVANGDMVTMALIQGVLNAFVIFFSRIIGYAIAAASRDSRGGGYTMGSFIGTMIAQIVLGFVAAIIINWFSRWREFHADQGGAKLAGNQKMIDALKALQRSSRTEPLEGEFAAFGISSGSKATLAKLFSTHPPLEDRIAALEKAQYGDNTVVTR
ncbi:protease HtpX [Marinicella sp. S1101]|uniref:protease HtpX n=1 Tax=Marinicella marina TaxID=2996016 RepID=UPI002260D0B8|nr:protease HtpX [Marinicella marina]MCX7554585.1 protease HtpX [Marinicella marina]MDJ1141031.1 protease HtpX [Marinicella marina]